MHNNQNVVDYELRYRLIEIQSRNFKACLIYQFNKDANPTQLSYKSIEKNINFIYHSTLHFFFDFSRWKFNRKYYKISTQLATFKNVTVDIVMIDTVELCGGLPPSGIMQPLGPHNVTAAEEQWSWLNEALKISA